MKKRTKLLTGALTVLAGVLLLSSCTASFCSETDKAHILYAFDYGVSDYCETKVEGAQPVFEGNTNIYYTIARPTNTGSGIGKTDSDAAKVGLQTPSNNYYVNVDKYVLKKALGEADAKYKNKEADADFADVTFAVAIDALDRFGYLKFSGEKLWDNWTEMNNTLKQKTADPTSGITLDDLPTNNHILQL